MPTPYHFEFREGRLFLERGDGAFRIDPWPRPESRLRLVEGADWIPCPPPLRLLQPLRRARPATQTAQLELGLTLESGPRPDQGKHEALSQFRSHLPDLLARALEPFRELQWQALVACSLSKRFADLLTSNPALAWLWLNRCQARGFCQEGAGALFAAQVASGGETNQRELLRHLGLRSTKAAVKLLRKCHAPALDSASADLLVTILRDERRMARLRHLPRMGRGVLAVAATTRHLQACSPALLLEIATCRRELHRAPTALLLKDHFRLLEELGMPLPRPFPTRQELRRQHDEKTLGFHELLRDLQENLSPPPPIPQPNPRPAPPREEPAAPTARPRQARPERDETLPAPPFPGNQHIVPLTARSQLRAEGRAQSNCVADYFHRVRKGTCYIYKVLWPQRCTLSLVKDRGGVWKCSELKLEKNLAVSKHTQATVREWIRSSQNMHSEPRAQDDLLRL